MEYFIQRAGSPESRSRRPICGGGSGGNDRDIYQVIVGVVDLVGVIIHRQRKNMWSADDDYKSV